MSNLNNHWFWLRDYGLLVNVGEPAITKVCSTWQRAEKLVGDGEYHELSGFFGEELVPDICKAQGQHDKEAMAKLLDHYNASLKSTTEREFWEDLKAGVYDDDGYFVF